MEVTECIVTIASAGLFRVAGQKPATGPPRFAAHHGIEIARRKQLERHPLAVVEQHRQAARDMGCLLVG